MTHDQPPIKGFVETSSVDWPGQTCAVISLPYCNLRCPYCYSHRLVLKADTLETIPLERILGRLAPLKNRVSGVCITGGEPTIHRGLPALLERIHGAGFRTKLDANGTQPEFLEYLMTEKLVDAVAMDVKAPLDDDAYERCAGVFVPVSIITKSIIVLMSTGVASMFRCTVTPTLLAEDDVYRLAGQLKGLWDENRSSPDTALSLTLQNFDPADPMEPDLQKVEPLHEQTLAHMQDQVNRILG
jgi:pyruvate formate lyase activating enzyme